MVEFLLGCHKFILKIRPTKTSNMLKKGLIFISLHAVSMPNQILRS